MTRLILARHGQSVANSQDRFAGFSNFDLTELGRKQAELAGEYIRKNYKVDKIYSSDLKRAYHTATPTAKLFGLTVEKREGLREIFAGEWETLTFDEIKEQYPQDFWKWRNDFPNSAPTDGETVQELYSRVCKEILEIAKENDGKCVFIATHATPVRAFECLARGVDPMHIDTVDCVANASINVFTVENGIASCEKINITEHLTPLVESGEMSLCK